MSFAISIDPINVIYTSINTVIRMDPAARTMRWAILVKKWIFFNAHTTANVQNRHVNVFQSKYSAYFASGGTAKQDSAASTAAMQNTVFFRKKEHMDFPINFGNSVVA